MKKGKIEKYWDYVIIPKVKILNIIIKIIFILH
jgi:hypothetical protein